MLINKYIIKKLCNIYYYISHKYYLYRCGGDAYVTELYEKIIIVFYDNYKNYINKPITLRLADKSYEKQEINSIQNYLGNDMSVLELGGSLGVTSVIINSMLNNKQNHIVCEANPNLIENLDYNRQINECKFTIINKPCSSNVKKVEFNYNNISLGGSIYDKSHKYKDDKHGIYKSVETFTTTPIIIEEKHDIKFNCLICDIEGEEYNLLIDMKEYFENYQLMIVEYHINKAGDKEKIENITNYYSYNFNVCRITPVNIVYYK